MAGPVGPPVAATIGRDPVHGRATEVHLVVEAVKQWRYEPTLVDGDPVPVHMTVTVSFRIG